MIAMKQFSIYFEQASTEKCRLATWGVGRRMYARGLPSGPVWIGTKINKLWIFSSYIIMLVYFNNIWIFRGLS